MPRNSSIDTTANRARKTSATPRSASPKRDLTKLSLIEQNNLVLTKEELAAGWHFCPDWDFLLIGPGTPELDGCVCDSPKKK